MTVSTAICRITVLMSGLLLMPAGAPALAGEVHVTDLRCEYLTEPVGIDETHPRLSWVITSDERGQKQTAYQILVARSQEQLNARDGDLWDSGKVDSEQSVHVAYAGKTLQSGQRCYWKVRVWDKEGDVSQWSAPAMWSMGLLNPEDWKGPWIGLDKAVFAENYPAAPAEIDFEGCRWIWYPEKNAAESAARGARFFRKHFTIPEARKIVRGTFAVAVDNQCVLYLNGERTGDHAEWKNGAAFTVTDLLHPGENVIAVQANNRDDAAGFIGKLLVEFDEGEPLAVVTNESWKAMKGPGNDWQQLGFDDKGWKKASDLGPTNTEPWSMPTAAVLGPTQTMPSPLLRKTFDAKAPVKSATVYVSGLGYYELRLNGEKVGNHELDPAFTRYDRRVLYSTYDVTDHVKEGPNAIGVMLGHGWYDMHTRATWDFDRAPWRAEPALLCQLRIEYADGSTDIIATDGSWQAAPGPIYFDSIRNGERYDARLEKPGWDTADYQEKWPAAALVEGPAGKLAAQMLPPARIVKTIEPVNIEEVSPGTWRFDMGQNISGKAELRVSGPAGTEITLKYRELLNEDGTLDHRNAVYVFSGDFQTDTYILKGKGTEVWSPRFVYHGYRYVQVEGLPNPPTEATLCAQVVHTDFETAGEFECSNPLLNRIQQNALWSYVGNYMGYPTDCPQREKNGWTGDAHLAAEMGLMNFRPAAAYTKWLDDFADEQNEAGEYAAIIPTCGWGYGIGPSWDCAYVLIPWYLYQYCGDTRILERHYENLKRYVEFLGTKADNYIVDYGLGDWCPPLGGSGSHKSPRMLTSTAYYYKDAELLARMAKVLGKTEDAAQYAALADNIKQAFNERLYDAETGLYAGETQ
ncbi:MAG: family 78 glycoside hydrolase catalytic domain, partial [Candidatus Hydrogenedentota bacterium]